MADKKKVLANLEYYRANPRMAALHNYGALIVDIAAPLLDEVIELLKTQEPITGETSDGYHTFNELYHHRAVLFSVIVANYPERAWKAKKHHDGTMYDGMFIVGIDTPDGQATYHYDIDPYWDMFKCQELENAPEWDGHTPTQAIERIGGLARLKAREPRLLTLGEVANMAANFQDYTLWFEPKELDEDMWFVAYAQPVESDETDIHIYEFGNDVPIVAKKYLYGKTWRCWTARPPRELREATPWE